MPNYAYVHNRPRAEPQQPDDWHLGHVIGLLLSKAPRTGSYTLDQDRPDGHQRSHVWFGRGPKWRVEPDGGGTSEISDGATRYVLSGSTVAEQGPADANFPVEVHPAFPSYAFIWGRTPGDEWRFVEGVEHSGNVLTARLERIRTPEETASVSVDIETGIMVTMETPAYSLRVRTLALTPVPPETFMNC